MMGKEDNVEQARPHPSSEMADYCQKALRPTTQHKIQFVIHPAATFALLLSLSIDVTVILGTGPGLVLRLALAPLTKAFHPRGYPHRMRISYLESRQARPSRAIRAYSTSSLRGLNLHSTTKSSDHQNRRYGCIRLPTLSPDKPI